MKYYRVPEKIWVGIIQYLEKQPFNEVGAALIQVANERIPLEDDAPFEETEDKSA